MSFCWRSNSDWQRKVHKFYTVQQHHWRRSPISPHTLLPLRSVFQGLEDHALLSFMAYTRKLRIHMESQHRTKKKLKEAGKFLGFPLSHNMVFLKTCHGFSSQVILRTSILLGLRKVWQITRVIPEGQMPYEFISVFYVCTNKKHRCVLAFPFFLRYSFFMCSFVHKSSPFLSSFLSIAHLWYLSSL